MATREKRRCTWLLCIIHAHSSDKLQGQLILFRYSVLQISDVVISSVFKSIYFRKPGKEVDYTSYTTSLCIKKVEFYPMNRNHRSNQYEKRRDLDQGNAIRQHHIKTSHFASPNTGPARPSEAALLIQLPWERHLPASWGRSFSSRLSIPTQLMPGGQKNVYLFIPLFTFCWRRNCPLSVQQVSQILS